MCVVVGKRENVSLLVRFPHVESLAVAVVIPVAFPFSVGECEREWDAESDDAVHAFKEHG